MSNFSDFVGGSSSSGGGGVITPDTSISNHGIFTSSSGPSSTDNYVSYTGTFYYLGCTAYTGSSSGGGTTTVYIGDYPNGDYFTLDSVSSSNRWVNFYSKMYGSAMPFHNTTITVRSTCSSSRANSAGCVLVKGVTS